MTKREITSLVIQLMGVFILIRSLSTLPMSLGNVFTVNWQDRGEWIGTLFFLGFLSVVPVVFSLAIILFSDKIAGWLIREDKPVEISTLPQKEDVLLVVFTCIGLYLIVTGIPNLIMYANMVLMNYSHRDDWNTPPFRAFSRFSQLIGPLVQVGLGVWLFAGSKGIVKLWQKIRS